MGYKVYGFRINKDKTSDICLVGAYLNKKDAEEKRDIENLCYSDDGIIFLVSDKYLVTDISYEEAIESVSK